MLGGTTASQGKVWNAIVKKTLQPGVKILAATQDANDQPGCSSFCPLPATNTPFGVVAHSKRAPTMMRKKPIRNDSVEIAQRMCGILERLFLT